METVSFFKVEHHLTVERLEGHLEGKHKFYFEKVTKRRVP